MSLNAGSVYAILGGRFMPTGFAQFDAAMKRSAASAAATEKQIAASSKGSSAAMMALGTAAKTGAAVGIAAVGAAAIVSIKKAANFEQAMADVQAVTKASAVDMKRLSEAALNLGAKTGVGATKAAGALAELAKGGLSTEQTIGALAGTIAMSQAGSMDLSIAANTVAQALNLFALKGEDASHVADAFATAANKTTADVGFFAQGLAQGGLAAKNAGLSFDETTAALETLAAAGFKSGSDAGTSLKTALTQLAANGSRTKKETDRLNLSLFDTKGSLKSLPAIASALGTAWKGMSDKQRIASASALVGQDGMRALLALYDQGPSKVRRFEEGLRQQGTAQDVANAKMDNLKGSWQRFTAQLQTMAIKVGTAMLPTLKTVADELTRFFDSLNRGDIRATGFGRFAQGFAAGAVPVLGVLKALASAAAWTLTALSKVPGPQQGMFKVWAAEARAAASAIGGIKNAMDDVANMKPKTPKLKVEADVRAAVRTLARMEGTRLGDKVVQVVASDGTAKQKIRALIALGIPPKQARVIVLGADQARGQIASVRDLMSTLSDKTVTLTTVIKRINQGGPSGFRSTPGNASGRGPGAAEASLVGEGGGPEWVGNPRDGWQLAAGPQIMGLGASDYVIPTEDRYRGRALMLMADALGLPGFKKGKGAKKKRPIPSHVYAEHSLDYYSQTVSDLESKANDRNKKQKLTKRAKEARAKLPKARADLKAAREYKAQIDKATSEADIQADLMRSADSKDDQKGYNVAFRKRRANIIRARSLLQKALKLNPKANAWTQSIRAQLARLGVDLTDLGDTPGAVFEEPGTFTDAQQKALDKLDAGVALAELTDTKTDDIDALKAKQRFLEPLLAQAQGAGRSTAVTEIAGMLKQTSDALTDAQKPPDITADQQLTTDQAFQRGVASARGSMIDRTIDRAFGGPQIIVNTLHPGDPATVRAIGDAAAAGFGYQQPRPASTVRVGV